MENERSLLMTVVIKPKAFTLSLQYLYFVFVNSDRIKAWL